MPMRIQVGAVAPLIAFGLAAHFIRPPDDGEQTEGPAPMIERRRYPPPELEIGVIAAFKIAGIILAPMIVVASLFGLYLQGFRSDLRLDVQKVVTEAIEKHSTIERDSYATLQETLNLRSEVERLRRVQEIQESLIHNQGELLQRVSQKAGVR